MTNYFVNTAENNLSKAFGNKKKNSEGSWTIWHTGAGVGLLGGLLLLFGGCFIIIFQYFSGDKPVGVWLFLAVLPLWILGAHCFDKVEETERAGKIKYCKQHGLTDEKCPKQK